MAIRLRIAQFNVENLLRRFSFARSGDGSIDEEPTSLLDLSDADRLRLLEAWHVGADDDKRQLTAQVIAAAAADIVCLQEVEDAVVLRRFVQSYLDRSHHIRDGGRRSGKPERILYRHAEVEAAYDRRSIDSAVLSRFPIVHLRSYRDLLLDEVPGIPPGLKDRLDKGRRDRSQPFRAFTRGCLEVDVEPSGPGGPRLTLFVVHFKAPSGEREEGGATRTAEALALRHVIASRFGAQLGSAAWLVCGDLNESPFTLYGADGRVERHGAANLAPLLDGSFAVDPLAGQPEDMQWSLYYGAADSYSRFDYILLSPALAAANPGLAVEVLRQGMPWRAAREAGPRLPRVGWDRPKASDHACLALTLALP